MELVLLVAIFVSIFAVYDAIRKVNANILVQTEELKKIREEIEKKNIK